jgi:hypothetical protein
MKNIKIPFTYILNLFTYVAMMAINLPVRQNRAIRSFTYESQDLFTRVPIKAGLKLIMTLPVRNDQKGLYYKNRTFILLLMLK